MKINSLKKSFPIIASVLVSSVALALFVTYETYRDQDNYLASSTVLPSSYDTIPVKRANPQDSLYNVLLNAADKYYNEKNYEKSQAELIRAQQIKPRDQSLKERITRLNGLVATQKEQREASQKSMASGDAYFKAKDYLNAKSAYQLAVSQDPGDEVPKEKLRKTLDLLRSQKAQNILFDVAVSSADKLFQAGDYEKAKQEYENAGRLLPGDPYPKNKINEIIKIQVDNQVKGEEYAKAVASADKFFLAKNYHDALLDYKKAGSLKPDEKYPQDRIKEVTGLLVAQKARDDAYNKSIALADQSFSAIRYPDAIKSYKDALVIKPEQAYPRDKIKEIEGILARITNAQAEYDKYIALADSFYIDKKYFKAREHYVMASSVKPAEAYPKEMISKADRLLTGQESSMAKAMEEQYLKTIAGADKLLADKSYEPARAEYVKATNLKPAEQYPRDKIAEIDNIFTNALKDKEEQYKLAISSGDRAFANKNFETARSDFQNALTIKPNEVYPKTKITEIEKLIAANAKEKAADARYANTIGKADSMLMAKAYLPAKVEFLNASKMKPDEVYPKNKIVEINQILYNLETQKTQDALYTGMLAKADKLLADKSYTLARKEFANASALKPRETYPQEKITDIDRILTDLVAAKALDDKYAGIIANADKLLAAKTYEQARTEYQNAGVVKPAETYPAAKIAEIDKILADLAAAKSLDENYTATIASADRHLAEKNYDLSKNDYTKASGLKPAEKYPITKIAEIDAILAGIARQKAIDDEYAATIVNADKLLADKSYEPAKGQYQSALKIKPVEQYPKDKISEIDKALAELASMKDRDDKYAASIANADKLLSQKSYAPARTEYVTASSLKPQESYPKDKISEIDTILAGIAAAKALDEKYTGILAGADKLLAAKTYDQARLGYQSAGNIKPEENYPREKIAEIDKILADIAAMKTLEENYKATILKADELLASKTYDPAKTEYVKASELKPAEQYPKTKIAEIDAALAAIAKQKALEDEYAAAIVNADKLLAEKNYEQAKTAYQKASALKAAEQYPRTKLAEIEKALADVFRLKAIEEQYATAIAGADKLLLEKTYDQAKIAYLDAGKIRPAEQYPKDKILEINDILAAIAKQKALDDQYTAALAKADQLLAAKNYDQAKPEYTNALDLKPTEQYPKDKIAEIEGVLAEMKAKEDAYKSSLATADQLLAQKKYEEARTEYQNALAMKPQATYPKTKIGEINKALEELLGKQKYYDNLIATADNSLKDKDYGNAKETYQQALGIFPAQPYPKTQINLITARVDSLYRANKSQYDKAVADGDRFYNSFEFDKAVDSYTDAVNFLPMEKYPREMIVKIRQTIAENAIADVLKTAVVIASNNEKQFPFTPVNVASRKNNFVYIKIKNLSGKPFNVLMRYGKDKQANGGVVMKNLNVDGKVNERLVSVKDQDLWSREDNNWISLYPQGGDVEVSFIQVSRAK